MIHELVLTAILLSAPVQARGRAPSMLGGKPPAKKEVSKPPAPPEDRKDVSDEEVARALAEYNAMKEKTPRTATAQERLAAWCEEHGLKAEAIVHYGEAIRLDPKRESAWKKLGYRKYGNRWMTEEQIAEVGAQKEADKFWAPRLRRIHRDIHGSNGARKRDAAREAFEAVCDEKAIPSLYREFGGGAPDQLMLIAALERIERPLATRAMAMLAVYGRTPEVRRRATETLRARPEQDYLEILVGLLVDTLKYEVRNVAGPGSPGVLFVEGERFNVARYYAPPPPPNIVPGPGDVITYDRMGMPIVNIPLGPASGPAGVPGSKTLVFSRQLAVRVSESDLIFQAETAAAMAESQLQGDVARLKSLNDSRRHFNDLVISVANYASGKNLGIEPEDWRKAVHAEKKYKEEPRSIKPTIDQMVPLSYQPRYSPQIGFMTKVWADS